CDIIRSMDPFYAIDAEVEPFDPQTAGEADWRQINAIQNRILADLWPDDPPRPLAATIAGWREAPASVALRLWGCRIPRGAIVGAALLALPRGAAHPALGQVDIAVAPEARRRDRGLLLLVAATEAANAAGCRALLGETLSVKPTAERMLKLQWIQAPRV